MLATRQKLLSAVAQVGKALGHGHRLALLERLAQSEAAVETLAAAAQLETANTSQHLQYLRRACLVTARRLTDGFPEWKAAGLPVQRMW